MFYAIKITEGHIQGLGRFWKQSAIPEGWTPVSEEVFLGLSFMQVVTNENGHLVFGEVDEGFTFTEPEPAEAGDVE